MKKSIIFLTLIICICLSSCTNSQGAIDLLKNEGYTDISMTGYSFFSCGEGDFYHTGFKAINTKGNLIKGVVCEGFFFKGKTIRYE